MTRRELSTPARVLAFVAALAAVFALTFGVGRAVGPITEQAPSHGGTSDQPH